MMHNEILSSLMFSTQPSGLTPSRISLSYLLSDLTLYLSATFTSASVSSGRSASASKRLPRRGLMYSSTLSLAEHIVPSSVLNMAEVARIFTLTKLTSLFPAGWRGLFPLQQPLRHPFLVEFVTSVVDVVIVVVVENDVFRFPLVAVVLAIALVCEGRPEALD